MDDVICWRCYAKASHYANACVLDIYSKSPVVKTQFEMLSNADKCRVPWGPYLRIMGYLTPGVENLTGPIDNPFARSVPEPAGESNSNPVSGN